MIFALFSTSIFALFSIIFSVSFIFPFKVCRSINKMPDTEVLDQTSRRTNQPCLDSCNKSKVPKTCLLQQDDKEQGAQPAFPECPGVRTASVTGGKTSFSQMGKIKAATGLVLLPTCGEPEGGEIKKRTVLATKPLGKSDTCRWCQTSLFSLHLLFYQRFSSQQVRFSPEKQRQVKVLPYHFLKGSQPCRKWPLTFSTEIIFPWSSVL